jgi:hypothetical protein
MAKAKQTSKRKRGTKAAPILGAAGLTFSLAGGASAATMPTADVSTQATAPNHEITLGEEELSDVSLSTFYVFDKENAAKPALGERYAAGCGHGCGRGCAGRGCGRGCGGCHGGCRCGWRGCAGCGGCGVPWCFSRGGCHAC